MNAHPASAARLGLLLTWVCLSLGVRADGWVSTASLATPVPGASLLGAMPASAPMSVAVSLKLPTPAALGQLIESMHTPGSPAFGSRLTPAQFVTAYGPSEASVQTVVSYLQGAGFTNIVVAPNRLLITADGTAGSVQTAFNTRINQYLRNGDPVFANASDGQVPTALSDLVLAVHGLQNAAHMQVASPHLATAASTGSAQGMMPPKFAIAYDQGGLAAATTTTVAIFMDGDVSAVLKDFRQEETQDGLPQAPVTIVQTDVAGTDTTGADEWDLDSQSSAGIAGNFSEMIWYAPSSLNDAPLLTAMTRWVSDNKALAANASFSECEDQAKTSGYLVASDQILMQAAAQGQTLFTSAGDNGFSCGGALIPNGVPLGQPLIGYAGSSPYAVAVGGTTLSTNADFTYASEKTWTDGGGGTSVIEAMPTWQNGIVNGAVNTTLGGKYKGTPDVSMDGDPSSGAIIIVNGKSEQVGGTSLSSPLAMGAWARIESQYGNRLGFAPPILYTLASGSTAVSGLHDIVTGSNVLYAAHAGWDYATGLGTFDLAAVSPLLAASASAPAGSSGSSGSGSSGAGAGAAGGGGALPPLVLLGLLSAAGLRRLGSGRRRI